VHHRGALRWFVEFASAGSTHPAMKRASFVRTALTLVAMIGSFVTTYSLCRWAGAQAAPAILSALLAMSLSRGDRAEPARAISSWLTLPAVALAATAVAWVVHVNRIAGAAVYVACMFASV
jgi:hypothetical protein